MFQLSVPSTLPDWLHAATRLSFPHVMPPRNRRGVLFALEAIAHRPQSRPRGASNHSRSFLRPVDNPQNMLSARMSGSPTIGCTWQSVWCVPVHLLCAYKAGEGALRQHDMVSKGFHPGNSPVHMHVTCMHASSLTQINLVDYSD